jgi:predicted ATPase
MITRVRAKNFRSLADIDVTLGPLTVLVGKNGAGKSAFIDVLRFTRDMIDTKISKALENRKGIENIRYSKSIEGENTEIGIWLNSKFITNFEGNIAVAISESGSIYSENGSIHIYEEEYKEEYETVNGIWKKMPASYPIISNRKLDGDLMAIRLLLDLTDKFSIMENIFTDIEFFTLFPDGLRKIVQEDKFFYFLENGRNFSSMLRMITESKHLKRRILESMKLIVDTIIDIRVTEAGGYLIPEIKHSDGVWRNLENESDGTVRLLGILCIINKNVAITGESPLIIEEPEISIYPEYLEVIANVIREASKKRQIIITTQSPDLISCFSADEIRVVENVDGQTKIGPLGKHQREIINQKLFSLGDLLRVEGLWREDTDA